MLQDQSQKAMFQFISKTMALPDLIIQSTLLESHNQRGVANGNESLLVVSTTTNPIAVDAF